MLFDDPRHDQEQVGVVDLLAGGGQQRVRLAAVVGLVVEEMGDEQPLRRRHLAVGGAAEPSQVTVKPGVVDPRRPALDIASRFARVAHNSQ